MDQETIHFYENLQSLNDSVLKTLGAQELFDLRHDMLALLDNLGELMSEI
ncbi:hypothetical protein LCM02_08330 [Lutimonas saemankumensis]|nr:hypothetical protein [Lutimonas saemankumensis]MCA0932455.1 hypothetical protein [Lutimonas saemankumensis]